MNIVSSILRAFGGQGEKAAATQLAGWVPIGGTADQISDRNLLDANREWVFIAVDKIARAVASVRFKVMRYSRNGDDQEVFDGPLVSFLENPGQGFTGKDFIYLNTVYKEVAGNAFWERVGGSKVKPIIPISIEPIVAKGELIGIRFTSGGEQRVLGAGKFLHDRYIDPQRPYWGVSRLKKVARWVDTSSFMTEFLNRFFTNGATFGGFIETEEETEARIKLIKAGLLNDHVGVEKAHKLGVLPKGAKYAKATANMAELQMSETDDRTRDKILAGFGVPKSILGLTTDVNRANAEAMEYVFAKYTVKPIVDDFIEFMNTNVADVLDPSGRYYFAYDEFIPENAEVQLKERELALAKQPYMTVNEVRATKGLPPVPGGDAVYGNPAFLPLGEPAPEPAAPANDDEDDDGEPKRALPSRARKSFSRVRSLEGFSSAVAKKVLEISTAADPDSESHKAFVGRVEDHQDLIADKVRDFNAQQERDVLGNLRQAVKAVTKDELFDEAAAVSVMVDFITPTLTGLFVEQAIAEFTAQGFEGRLDQSQPRIAALIATAAKRLAKNYNETTATLLLAQINEGIRDGEGLDKLSERVRQVYAFSNEHRAAQVARTEAFYIANEGSKEAYRQSGVVKTMRWYTSESERVCEFCAPQHGRVIGVSEVFFPKGHELIGEQGGKMTLNYRTIDVPPLHPNCSCFIRPEEISVS